MNENNNYTTGHLLDIEYFSRYYKLIAIHLNKQVELENPDLKQQINSFGKQQINSFGRLEEDNGETRFFIIEKSEETTINFSQNSVCIR